MSDSNSVRVYNFRFPHSPIMPNSLSSFTFGSLNSCSTVSIIMPKNVMHVLASLGPGGLPVVHILVVAGVDAPHTVLTLVGPL